MPLVPVVSFWSTRESISLEELQSSAAAGSVLMAADDAAALGWSVPFSATSATADEIKVAVREPGVMGILRASDVDQSVRGLGINDVHLFGNDRVEDIGQWPLVATVQSSETWDQSASWTLIAVGDMHFDRLVRTAIEASGQRSYPFDGGTAEVTAVRCCSFFNYQYPIVARTGNRGLMHELISGSDLTIGNMEIGRARGRTTPRRSDWLHVHHRCVVDAGPGRQRL